MKNLKAFCIDVWFAARRHEDFTEWWAVNKPKEKLPLKELANNEKDCEVIANILGVGVLSVCCNVDTEVCILCELGYELFIKENGTMYLFENRNPVFEYQTLQIAAFITERYIIV